MNYLKFIFTLIFTISSFNVFADESEDIKKNDNDVKVEILRAVKKQILKKMKRLLLNLILKKMN